MDNESHIHKKKWYHMGWNHIRDRPYPIHATSTCLFYPLINGLYLVFKSSKFFLFVYKVQHLAVYTFKIRNMLQIPTPALSPLPLRHFSPLPSAPPHRLSLPSPPSGRKFGKSSTLIRKTLLPARHLSTQILEQQISLLFPFFFLRPGTWWQIQLALGTESPASSAAARSGGKV